MSKVTSAVGSSVFFVLAPGTVAGPLVIGGLYRHVRNPMYLAVLAVIAGQALVLGRPVLLAYAALVWAALRGVRALVRGADAAPPVRSAVRGLPPRGPGWWPRSQAVGARQPGRTEDVRAPG